MPIEIVLYRKEKDYEEITLEDIETRDDYDQIKKNLYCAFDGCLAQMEYVPKGQRAAYFKTWPRSDHTLECYDFFEREEKNRKKKNVATSSIAITDKHINNVLRSLINSVAESEEEREKRLEDQRKKRNKSTSPIVEKSGASELNDNTRPVTGDDVETIAEEGKRAPTVRKRHSIAFLSEDDLDTATALFEKVNSISIEEDRVIFGLKKNNAESNIYLEKAFFAKAPVNILNMFKQIKSLHEKGNEIEIYCVGNVEMRNDKLSLVVNSHEHIRINKLRVARYIFEINNSHLLK